MTADNLQKISDGTGEKYLLNCRGLLCPMPVYKTNLAMKKLAPGEVLEVTATDKAAVRDIPAWAQKMDVEVVEMSEHGNEFRIKLRKKGV